MRAIRKSLRAFGGRIQCVGIGAKHLPNRSEIQEISTILLCGLAGGLDPSLNIGDIVVDGGEISPYPRTPGEGRGEGDFERQAAFDIQNHPHPNPLPAYRERGPELRPLELLGTQYRRGIIHTANAIIASPAQKGELFQQTGALAVDMEQAIVRQWAAESDIQVIGIRSISDTSAHVLDPAVAHLVDDLGKPRPLQIAAQLLRRPSLIPYLQALNKNTNIALNSLAIAVRGIVEQLEGT